MCGVWVKARRDAGPRGQGVRAWRPVAQYCLAHRRVRRVEALGQRRLGVPSQIISTRIDEGAHRLGGGKPGDAAVALAVAVEDGVDGDVAARVRHEEGVLPRGGRGGRLEWREERRWGGAFV